MEELGFVIKQLQQKHDIQGKDLAAEIGIAPPNLSQIINGHAKPRQSTFTNLCKALAKDAEEEKRLVDAFIKLKGGVPASEISDPIKDAEGQRQRAKDFLRRKAESIQFKQAVAAELEKAGIAYTQDYTDCEVVTDFLINPNGKRIALECKANVGRDMERTEAMCTVIGENLGSEVVIVVPYLDGASQEARNHGAKIAALSELPELI
ncbi:MAG: helix-turn-helix domain-containing protein [Opitutales bacterium]